MRPTISNATLASIDWAAADRQAFLRGIPKARRRRDRLHAGLPARGVWMTDVSAIDRRSVKAYLMGRGDYRVRWWQLNQRVHRLLLPGASLEQVMCTFHQRHHAMTIGRLTLEIDYAEIFQAIRQRGVRAGMQRTIGRFRCPPGEQ